MEKLLMTVEEAAEVLRIGRSSAYELVARGSLRSMKIGRCRRVLVSSVEAYVRAQAAEDEVPLMA